MGKKIKAFSFKDQKINLPFEVELSDNYINLDSLAYTTYILLTVINKLEERLTEAEDKLKEIKND
jgi:hypothetical protein